MKDSIYTLLNDMDIQVEDYEIAEVSSDEMKHWKKTFKQNQNKETKKKRYVGRYVAAVVLVSLLVIAPFKEESYAQMRVLTCNVQEWLGIENDLSLYETLVNQTIVKDGITITVNDVILDGETMMVSYTTTSSEKIDTAEKERDLLIDVTVYVNGKEVFGGKTGDAERVDDYNIISADKIILDDVDVTKNNYYQLVFYAGSIDLNEEVRISSTKIGEVDFVANDEKLCGNTIEIPLNEEYEFPNGEKVRFTKYTYNSVGPKIYCDSETFGFNYAIDLKGQDNLGNEIAFYLTHYGEDGGWLVLHPYEGNYIREEATSLTLRLYALEYPEESGDMGNDYQVVGEPFTIELK